MLERVRRLRAGLGAGASALAALALALCLAAPGAGATEVYRGKAAQALRCASYIGMTASLALEAGKISRADYDALQASAAHILKEWVPAKDPMPAYAAALAELSGSGETFQRFLSHADYCMETFVYGR